MDHLYLKFFGYHDFICECFVKFDEFHNQYIELESKFHGLIIEFGGFSDQYGYGKGEDYCYVVQQHRSPPSFVTNDVLISLFLNF